MFHELNGILHYNKIIHLFPLFNYHYIIKLIVTTLIEK
jgi:hypothetical protein